MTPEPRDVIRAVLKRNCVTAVEMTEAILAALKAAGYETYRPEECEVIAWCPKHHFMRNHTDANFLCMRGSGRDACGQGEYRHLLATPVDVVGRLIPASDDKR